ncbi:MAG: hypothetical protein MJA27_04025 [Pseudanabaenales cyanobacterium]|nr:hypothetical protein [Pseudanabaenales cyanobacterium]
MAIVAGDDDPSFHLDSLELDSGARLSAKIFTQLIPELPSDVLVLDSVGALTPG